MQKWRVYVCALLCLFGMTACGRQATEREVIGMIADQTYLYEKDGFGGSFSIRIDRDGTFTYYEGYLSSYIGKGSWVVEDNVLVLSDDDQAGYPFVNRFRVDQDALVFLSEDSSNFIYVKVADGDRFNRTVDEVNAPVM